MGRFNLLKKNESYQFKKVQLARISLKKNENDLLLYAPDAQIRVCKRIL